MKKPTPEIWRSRIIGSCTMAPSDLIPNPKNWRKHPAYQQAALEAVLGDVGWFQQVVWNQQTGRLIDGHLRVDMAKTKGEATMPVLLVDLSEEEETIALATLDPIAGMAKTNHDKLEPLLRSIQSEDAQMRDLIERIAAENKVTLSAVNLPEDQGAEMDRAAELQTKWSTEAGQLWKIGSVRSAGGQHRLLIADATLAASYETLMENQYADLIFTDPPYNVDYEGKTAAKLKIANDATRGGEQFYSFLRAACAQMMAWNKGAAYVCMSSSELHTLQRAWTDAGGHWSTFVIWAKHHFTLGRSDYQRQYEPILYGWKEGVDHYWSGVRDQGDVWFIDRPTASREHPTMKPVALVERALLNSTKNRDIVLDAFLGSGTTMVAAERQGRLCYGMELDPSYAAVVLERLSGMNLIPELVGKGRTVDGEI